MKKIITFEDACDFSKEEFTNDAYRKLYEIYLKGILAKLPNWDGFLHFSKKDYANPEPVEKCDHLLQGPALVAFAMGAQHEGPPMYFNTFQSEYHSTVRGVTDE